MIQLYFDNNSQQSEEDDSSESDPEKLKKKAEIWWGLSDSSTNLAKALLPSDFITLSPSKDLSYFDQEEPVDKISMHTPTEEEEEDEFAVLDTDQLIAKKDSSFNLITTVGPTHSIPQAYCSLNLLAFVKYVFSCNAPCLAYQYTSTMHS